ncbi:Appr-1-p processing protein [candidate division KSB3 bacterium]|uniref:Appr-1-p processing protein n=1 Tax=candidate division KSB3 bacterium TaxID=2044937 RepID=A0A2G6E262_9BACT|nr:MAG: Appr-1-p processing protein [candidate division KSB3 bacterium]PIE28438.1 MAG: Appr-1-p processing protein [candidate division KSB3 bacterium]
MSLKIITGNIFTSNCQTIVNTINCVGVMGAGIALECRLRYPDMHKKYIDLCNKNKIDIGLLWIYKLPKRWILNFPTKKHWKYPSKKEYLYSGLEKFVSTYKERGIESIAFPLLGADKGGIPQEESLSIIRQYLEPLDIEVEVYRYSAVANDDLFEKTKKWLLSQDVEYISQSTKLRKDYVIKVLNAMQSHDIHQLNQLGKVKGIGIKTLEKVFNFTQQSQNIDSIIVNQQTLL